MYHTDYCPLRSHSNKEENSGFGAEYSCGGFADVVAASTFFVEAGLYTCSLSLYFVRERRYWCFLVTIDGIAHKEEKTNLTETTEIRKI